MASFSRFHCFSLRFTLEMIRYYILLILAPLTLYSGWMQFEACLKAEPMYPKGILFGAITMLNAFFLVYIFLRYYYIVEYYYIVKDF